MWDWSKKNKDLSKCSSLPFREKESQSQPIPLIDPPKKRLLLRKLSPFEPSKNSSLIELRKKIVQSEKILPSIKLKQKHLGNSTLWIEKFNQMYFPGMDLIQVRLKTLKGFDSLSFKKVYQKKRREFLFYLAENYKNDLRSAGIDEESILLLSKGIINENHQIHLKIPPYYGGTIDFSNMILIQTHPYHEEIHTFINEQIAPFETSYLPDLLYLPYPRGKVFVPPSLYTGSGGKGKHDRSAFAGYSLDAYKKISIKTMPGR
ncbi:MAG: hypothetical protein PHI50_03035 [Alphaproteobacteria bacterium]|nr:hypothetical protein [Alphaproteobacteria bacterium]